VLGLGAVAVKPFACHVPAVPVVPFMVLTCWFVMAYNSSFFFTNDLMADRVEF
jgi:hypothetical protein